MAAMNMMSRDKHGQDNSQVGTIIDLILSKLTQIDRTYVN